MDPSPFKFHQLMVMREAVERESWDRHAHWCAIYDSGQGAKNVTMSSYHKFEMDLNKPQMSKEHLHSLKGMLEEK